MSLGNVIGYEVSADGKKMIVSRGQWQSGIIVLPRGPIDFKPLDLGGMEVRLDRQAEWKQIFNECWRQMRDFFYDPGLHGVDWPAMKKKYEVLVPHVRHRYDLTYVIGEMISELNIGHAYVGGGEAPEVARVKTGLLGAELKKDPKTGYFKIEKVLKGANWNPALRSPLTEIGVDVHEGDYIVKVNGKPVNEVGNIYELLLNTPGRLVTLDVNKEPAAGGARALTVTPIADELQLYYYDWVEGNIEKVAKATDGKVGYIHVPDMQTVGLNEFAKHFYPQLQKKALIIDVRGNGGGDVSPMLIDPRGRGDAPGRGGPEAGPPGRPRGPGSRPQGG